MSKWDAKQIDYVAKLARLQLSPEEKGVFAQQLANIIKYIEKLNELDTANVEPTAHILSLNNVWRQDEEQPSLDRALLERIMPAEKDGFFKVPPVIE